MESDFKTENMTKIENLTELLVSELKGFEKGIAKLEALTTKIDNTQVELNLKELKPLLKAQEKALHESKRVQESYIHRLESVVEGANFYPKWAIITFVCMIFMCCLGSFYAYTIKTDFIVNENAAYTKGENAGTEYINLYLSENPKGPQKALNKLRAFSFNIYNNCFSLISILIV